ncbi:MAG: type II secretion system F family protein, partial [Gammaproteobacteria bacterium]|nr:type II secretion system F family protein [Gammaproteobacteria bacterium]
MAEFIYRGRGRDGNLIDGILDADNAEGVATRLVERGITPVDIRPATGGGSTDVAVIWRRLGGGRPQTKDMVMFCRQMNTITRAGIPLLRGLGSLAQSTHHPMLREALNDIIESLQAGRGLTESLRRHPEIFTPLFVNIVDVGENTGTLDTAFQRLYEYLRQDEDVRKKVTSAVRYPILVMGAIVAALIVISVFVIPNFAPLFAALGDDIPLPTLIIMSVSDFIINQWLWIIVGVIVALYLARRYTSTEHGRMRWD